MTAPRPGSVNGWRGCVPELCVTAVLVAVTTGAAWGYAGAGVAVITLIIWAVVLLAGLRALLAAPETESVRALPENPSGRTGFSGMWRASRTLSAASEAMVSYDAELRPTLQHLLAARLSERHGINFYADPAAARALLLGGSAGHRADALWYWLDPARPAETRQRQRGIPPRTLAAILDRLERL